MAELGTIVRNTCRVPGAGPEAQSFDIVTTPNAKQRRALEMVHRRHLLVRPRSRQAGAGSATKRSTARCASASSVMPNGGAKGSGRRPWLRMSIEVAGRFDGPRVGRAARIGRPFADLRFERRGRRRRQADMRSIAAD